MVEVSEVVFKNICRYYCDVIHALYSIEIANKTIIMTGSPQCSHSRFSHDKLVDDDREVQVIYKIGFNAPAIA